MSAGSEEPEVFEEQRSRMFGIAYRMLGSVTDAEEVLQDAWLRWQSADRAGVADPGAFLARTVTNLCLNQLTSARARREVYVGPWLPEPVLTRIGGHSRLDDLGPLELAMQRETVSFALLTLLERLTPGERAAYVLREAFGYSHREVADLIGTTEANARQLHSRARKRLAAERVADGRSAAERAVDGGSAAGRVADRRSAAERVADGGSAAGRVADRRSAGRVADGRSAAEPVAGQKPADEGAGERGRRQVDPVQWRELVERFLAAAWRGDVAALEAMLVDGVVARADGGGVVNAARNPVEGAEKVARYLVGVLQRFGGGVVPHFGEANGEPAIIATSEDGIRAVCFVRLDGDRISRLDFAMNPVKLRFAERQLSRIGGLSGLGW